MWNVGTHIHQHREEHVWVQPVHHISFQIPGKNEPSEVCKIDFFINWPHDFHLCRFHTRETNETSQMAESKWGRRNRMAPVQSWFEKGTQIDWHLNTMTLSLRVNHILTRFFFATFEAAERRLLERVISSTECGLWNRARSGVLKNQLILALFWEHYHLPLSLLNCCNNFGVFLCRARGSSLENSMKVYLLCWSTKQVCLLTFPQMFLNSDDRKSLPGTWWMPCRTFISYYLLMVIIVMLHAGFMAFDWWRAVFTDYPWYFTLNKLPCCIFLRSML